MSKKYLIIQTASLGDVILSLSLAESIYEFSKVVEIDYVVKPEYAILFKNHLFIKNVYFFDRKLNKFKEVFRLLKLIRSMDYDAVFCVQRFFTAGLLTAFSKANIRSGFKKNPFSFLFTHSSEHSLNGLHEIERNHNLLACIGINNMELPKLYCSPENFDTIAKYQNSEYVTIAPASLWKTKQFPEEKWVEFINKVSENISVYITGGVEDIALGEKIVTLTSKKNCFNLCGKLNIMESAALMKGALMNYMNDSAPIHIASAVNANTTAVFCSTIPKFGFRPLSSNSKIVETDASLKCRPCGIHGRARCPEQHFNCAYSIDIQKFIDRI